VGVSPLSAFSAPDRRTEEKKQRAQQPNKPAKDHGVKCTFMQLSFCLIWHLLDKIRESKLKQPFTLGYLRSELFSDLRYITLDSLALFFKEPSILMAAKIL